MGQAGEFLAASVLQRHFQAIAFPQSLTAYDLIAHHASGKFLKCQVKTAEKQKDVRGYKYWKFDTRKSSGLYGKSEIDFFALVVLPKRIVTFLDRSESKSICYLKDDQVTAEREQETLEKVLGLHI